MSDWKENKLENILTVFSGVGLPQHKIIFGNNPVYGGNGINGYHSKYLFEKQQIIIGRVGEHCGNVHLTKPKSWVTDNALVVSFIVKKEDLKFWFYYLTYLNLKEYAFRGAQPVITGATVNKISAKVPDYTTQRKIAHILSTADAVIEKTQATIAKYKAIKQGMLHDLFTCGIDLQTGKLRPKYEDAPHLYKPSKLGWIPKEWEVERLEKSEVEIIDGDRGVNYPKENDLNDSGYCLFLSATNVTKNGFKFEATQFISKEKDEILGTGKLRRNDIIVTTRGTVGNVALYEKSIPYNHIRINSGMIILRNSGSKIKNEFLFHYLKDYLFKILYQKSLSGSAQPQLPIKDLKKFFIIYSKRKEQNEISERLKTIDNKIQTEQNYLQKLQHIKAGLMNDLLSGKRKVKIEEEFKN